MVLTVVAEIALRFYLTIGFVSLLVLLALAITSTDEWVKHLGRNWKRLHRLAYPLGAVARLHFYIQAKLNVSEPVFVSGLFVWLMLWRAVPETWRRDRRITFTAALYSGLAAVSGVATVVMEFGWYGLTTKIDPWRVLYANETIAQGLRPAHWVIVATAALMITFVIRRSMGPTRQVRQVAA
jgi:sulfoxide reductase heme-binding subunit YedZ